MNQLMELKNRFYHLNLRHCKSKSNLKQYFNNKSLAVYVTHVLLAFFIYFSQLHSIEYIIKSISIFKNVAFIIYSSDSSSDSFNFRSSLIVFIIFLSLIAYLNFSKNICR